MVPQASVVIVEESDGEGVIDIKNTDADAAMLLTHIQNIPEDQESLVTISPPVARVEPGKSQRVRFIITNTTPLKTERLKRVTFEGIPPHLKDESKLKITFVQNLPVIIRPAGLKQELAAWEKLTWTLTKSTLEVNNPSPYVVRLGQGVQTLPDNTAWTLPRTYVLPGETLAIKPDNNKIAGDTQYVRISPATTWGFTVNSYDAPVINAGCNDC